MLGPYLLVAPVVTEGADTRTVYMPAGSRWFDFATGQEYAGGTTVTVDAPLEVIPIFVREGSLLVTGPALQYVDEPVESRVEIQVYPGSGEFTLYEDDGEGFEYQTGDHLRSRIRSSETAQSVVVTVDPLEGSWSASSRVRRLRFHQASTSPQGVTLNGAPLDPHASEAEMEASGSGWFYSVLDQQLLVALPDSGAATISVTK
jgi:alpha-glucosidase (family GH31 glycosyl hydrolase)